AGQVVTVGLKHFAGSGTTVAIQDSSGNTLMTSMAAVNVEQAINNYAAPADGTYYIVVSGTSAASYNLVVTRDAAFDTEANDTYATAQPLDGNRGVIGAIYSPVVPSS